MTQRTPVEELRGLCDDVRQLVNEVPGDPLKDSPRAKEHVAVRATSGGGGFRRAAILERLNADTQLVAAHTTLVVDGLADCFAIASQRDNEVNTTAASIIVRSALEIAGQIAWLLEDSIGGDERARRALVWRFNDLRQQRILLGQFKHADVAETAEELDRLENWLIEDAAKSKWGARPTIVGPKDTQHAALLNAGGKQETMPKYGALVALVQSTPSLYSMLSAAAHGTPFAVMLGIDVQNDTSKDGSTDISLRGFGVTPPTALGLGAHALTSVARHLAGWNGLDPGPVVARMNVVLRVTGLRA